MGLFQLPLQFSVLIKSLWQKLPVVQRPPPNEAVTGTTITTISNKSNCYSCQTRKKPQKMPSYDQFQTFSIGLWLLVPKITISRLLFSQHVTGVPSKMFEMNICRNFYWPFSVLVPFSTFCVLCYPILYLFESPH